MKSHSRGFTLIELLVVISIIALLSSVVISSLGTARTRGADSAIKAAMKEIQTQAQNYLDSANQVTFGTATGAGACSTASTLWTDTRVTEILANIQQNAGAVPTCDSTGTKFAIAVVLKSGTSWCADNSQGWFKAGTVSAGNGICQ